VKTLATVLGSWEVTFPPNLGAPASVRMEKLASLTDSSEEGVKYFSGTATYTKTLQAPASWFAAGSRVVLNLGVAKDLAEVSVNGKDVGLLWKPPYKVDVTGALKPGANRIEVKVTNEWTNRQAGDRLLPEDKRVLAPGPRAFGAPPPLPESGLIGPVTVVSVRAK
jgi:hypothetical protein